MSIAGAIIGAIIGFFLAMPLYLHGRLMQRLHDHIMRLEREIGRP